MKSALAAAAAVAAELLDADGGWISPTAAICRSAGAGAGGATGGTTGRETAASGGWRKVTRQPATPARPTRTVMRTLPGRERGLSVFRRSHALPLCEVERPPPCTVCTSRPLPLYVLIVYCTRVIGALVVNAVP